MIINCHEHIESFDNITKLREANKMAGITKTIILGSPSATILKNREGFSGYKKYNDVVLKISSKYPSEFLSFPTLGPKDNNKLGIIKKFLNKGATGLKLYTGHSLFYDEPLDTRMMNIVWEFSESNQIPIIWHVNAVKYLEEMINVFDKYPRLKINIPHFMLRVHRLDVFDYVMTRFSNVFTDISFGFINFVIENFNYIDDIIDQFRNTVIKYQDRIMFGTDIVITSARYKTPNWLFGSIQVYKDFLEKEVFVFSHDKNRVHRGLKLPIDILEKIYFQNCSSWLSEKHESNNKYKYVGGEYNTMNDPNEEKEKNKKEKLATRQRQEYIEENDPFK